MASNKIVWNNHTANRKQTFLQPLAIGIASAVFIILVLFMGVMDLKRSERSLTGFIENQGLAVTAVVQRLTQENLDILVHIHQDAEEEKTFAPLRDEALYPQAWLTTELADLGKEIDNKWKAGKLNEADLEKIAADNALWLVAVMNKEGRVAFQSRSLPLDFSPGTASPKKLPEITFGLLAKLAHEKKIGYIALQRKDKTGTVVIALDREGLLYWSMKVSVQKAIDKLGEFQKQGLVFMVIQNKKGMILGSSGIQPRPWDAKEMNIDEIFAGGKKIESRKVMYEDRNILDMTSPLTINGKIAGIVRLGLETESADVVLNENSQYLVGFMIFVVFITLFSMWLLYHNQNKHLAGIVEMERRLEKAERLSALGQLAAGVAHEIRNPLNAISMASQRLKRDFVPPAEDMNREFQLLSGIIRDEIRRLNGIIEEFLSFSKTRKLELHSYPVREVLQKIVNLISEEASSREIVIKTRWDTPPLIIPMDMDKLQQALLNFVKNAMESIDGAGAITLAVTRRDKDYVAITIADTGCGMTVEEAERIFNPEYTTKEKGLGLGLPLAHEIIRGHGGEIRVFSTQGQGTTFEILLPSEKLMPGAQGGQPARGEF